MWFDFTLLDAEDGCKEVKVVSTAGDFTRVSKWAEANLDRGMGENVGNMMRNYALVWFALQRLGRLGEFGLPSNIDEDCIIAMQDRLAITDMNELDSDDAPLAGGRSS